MLDRRYQIPFLLARLTVDALAETGWKPRNVVSAPAVTTPACRRGFVSDRISSSKNSSAEITRREGSAIDPHAASPPASRKPHLDLTKTLLNLFWKQPRHPAPSERCRESQLQGRARTLRGQNPSIEQSRNDAACVRSAPARLGRIMPPNFSRFSKTIFPLPAMTSEQRKQEWKSSSLPEFFLSPMLASEIYVVQGNTAR